jgi:hypothetical protein
MSVVQRVFTPAERRALHESLTTSLGYGQILGQRLRVPHVSRTYLIEYVDGLVSELAALHRVLAPRLIDEPSHEDLVLHHSVGTD